MTPQTPPQPLARNIQQALRREPVVLAYLFGSHAHGRADSESDVDIAVLADSSLSRGERQTLRLKLMRTCAEALTLPIERIDLVVLQDVPVLLQYNVIRGGLLLCAKNPSVRPAYEFAVEQSYDDERPLLEREADLTFERILSHGQ